MLKINENIKKQIMETLEKQNIMLAYIFGSYVSGKVSALSDFDLAILFSKEVNQEDYFERELKIAGEIGRIMKIDKVDVVNLMTVRSPLLKHSAVFYGQPIFVKDKNFRFIFEKIIRQEYEDTEYLRETSYKILNRQIKETTFGAAPIYVADK